MQNTYINAGHLLSPTFHISRVDEGSKTTSAIGTEHVSHVIRPILVPLQLLFALYPFNVIVSAIRNDVEITVFGANGAVAVDNGGKRARRPSCRVQRPDSEASAGAATMAVGIVPYFVIVFLS